MRILIISQWYRPEPNLVATTLSKALAGRGHEVHVLTGFPNYPEGRIYPGYRLRFYQREVWEGVNVFRAPLYPSHDNSAIKRMLNYGSFALSSALAAAVAIRRPDVVYVYHPPASVGLAAEVLRVIRGVPFVYHIQDMWPDTLAATGMLNTKAMLRLVERWCRRIYRNARDLIVLSPGFKRLLVERGVPEHKIHVVYNWSDEQDSVSGTLDASVAAAFSDRSKFRIVYAGNIGKAQGLTAVVEAARLVAHGHPGIEFLFIGDGVALDELKAHAKKAGATNVRFLPRQPRSAIKEILALADVVLVHLKDDPLFEMTIPSKTQAYLAIGRPLLVGVRGDTADLVTRAGAGLVCRPEDPQSLAQAALQFARMAPGEREAMGRRGREFYERHLSLQQGVERIEGILLGKDGLVHAESTRPVVPELHERRG